MKKIFATVVSVVVLASLVVPAMAQQAGPRNGAGSKQGAQGGQRGERQNQMRKIEEAVMAKLNLTGDQKTKIKALNEKTEAEMKKIMAEMQGKRGDENARKAIMEKMRKVQESRRDTMNKILTKEQQAQYQKLMKAEMDKLRKERGEKGRGGPGAAGGQKGGNGGKGGQKGA